MRCAEPPMRDTMLRHRPAQGQHAAGKGWVGGGGCMAVLMLMVALCCHLCRQLARKNTNTLSQHKDEWLFRPRVHAQCALEWFNVILRLCKSALLALIHARHRMRLPPPPPPPWWMENCVCGNVLREIVWRRCARIHCTNKCNCYAWIARWRWRGCVDCDNDDDGNLWPNSFHLFHTQESETHRVHGTEAAICVACTPTVLDADYYKSVEQVYGV